MARPSKSKHFAIYEDAGIPTPDSDESYQPSFDDAVRARQEAIDEEEEGDDDVFTERRCDEAVSDGSELEDIEEAVEVTDDERRESAITSTSVSSLPESSTDTDQERSLPMHKPYTPPMIRPSFRRPESVRRMQMTSPIPFERSPRRSALHSQSRSGTPRSARSSVKGSPRSRRSQYEECVEVEKKEYPLVLLHVSLLPVELRWSMEAMQEVLPQSTLDNLQRLRSKVTETILQRGILIPHPREEYELLEERLLEALELRKERVTKCGHFRARDSISSASSEEGSLHSDSGVGSSVDSDGELCITCRHHLKTARPVHGSSGSRWNIRVFAANGLMRASAWAAAWSEMERVDVEILPWIGEDLRRQLDARMEQEDVDETLNVESPSDPIREPAQAALPPPPMISAAPQETPEPEDPHADLPQVYRAKDVPLSLLLKNYIFLLAKDKRNIAIFGLAVLAMWLSLRAALVSPTLEISSLPPVCELNKSEPVQLDTSESRAEDEASAAVEVNASIVDIALTEKSVSSPIATTPEPATDLESTMSDDADQATDMQSVETCDNPASAVRLFQRGHEVLDETCEA
ncbi:hypothetical protein M409DRAFT_61443 [Zasmidium cellare ATCC 36951]|uniref:Pathway-specific nitrogen regulator n=1 Tax=Zasmidium cellare ATCC 36951 TaxID=1080233 RepID=A0A6A6BZ11_ZASCE|nr:uncharacterized protein M409DRAFT_61443 [Zasmidium cellare ATCC 36951]KAF2158656.1 hypothetical protein M409DRAFT_61443 [Zasmidium cellare ATCC 36951]